VKDGLVRPNVIVIDLVGVIERPGPIDVGVDAIADWSSWNRFVNKKWNPSPESL